MNRVIHEEANREFREALDYYAQIDSGLGVRFYREMERLMLEVCDRPFYFGSSIRRPADTLLTGSPTASCT